MGQVIQMPEQRRAKQESEWAYRYGFTLAIAGGLAFWVIFAVIMIHVGGL